MMKHFKLWCAATRRVLHIEARSFFQDAAWFVLLGLRRLRVSPAFKNTRCGGLRCLFWDSVVSRHRFANTCAGICSQNAGTAQKPLQSVIEKKGVLGLPLLHHNSARFTCVWVVPSSIFLTLFCSIYECLSPHPRRWPTTLRLIIDVGTTQVPDMCCFLVWCGEVLTGVL